MTEAAQQLLPGVDFKHAEALRLACEFRQLRLEANHIEAAVVSQEIDALVGVRVTGIMTWPDDVRVAAGLED